MFNATSFSKDCHLVPQDCWGSIDRSLLVTLLVVVAGGLTAPQSLRWANADAMDVPSAEDRAAKRLDQDAAVSNPLERRLDHFEVAAKVRKLQAQAFQCMATGDLEVGARRFSEVADMCARKLPENHPLVRMTREYATAFSKVSELEGEARASVIGAFQREIRMSQRQGKGDPRQLLPMFYDIRFFYESALGPNHLLTLCSCANLADLQLRCGEISAARENLKAVIADATAALGDQHPLVGEARCHLGRVLLQEMDAPGAEENLRAGLAIHEPNIAGNLQIRPAFENCIDAHWALACLLNDRDAATESLAVARRALTLLASSNPGALDKVLPLEIEIARSLSRLNKVREADVLFACLARKIRGMILTRMALAGWLSDVALRQAIAHVEHLRGTRRDAQADDLRLAVEGELQTPLPECRLGQLIPREVAGFELRPRTTARPYRDLSERIAMDLELAKRREEWDELALDGHFARLADLFAEAAEDVSARLGASDRRLTLLDCQRESCIKLSQLSPELRRTAAAAYRSIILSRPSPNRDTTAQSLSHSRNGFERISQCLGPDEYVVAQFRMHLALFAVDANELELARDHIAPAIATLERHVGLHYDVGRAERCCAQIEFGLGKPEIAERHVRRAIAILEPFVTVEGDERLMPEYARCRSILAEILLDRGERELALELAELANDLYLLFPEIPGQRLTNAVVLANCLSKLGRSADADRVFEQNGHFATMRMVLAGDGPPAVVHSIFTAYSTHLESTGRQSEAESQRKSLSTRVPSPGAVKTTAPAIIPTGGEGR